jgi:hypothetical protein
MKTVLEADVLHRDDSNRNSCRPDEFTMSESFNVPLGLECPSRTGAPAARAGGAAANGRNRRRSTRRAFEAIIRVYGINLDGCPFYEDARTIDVSVHGALMILNVPVSKGEKLLLFNEATKRQQVCKVTDVRIRDAERFEVAVSFPTPHAEFWHIPAAPNKMRVQNKIN